MAAINTEPPGCHRYASSHSPLKLVTLPVWSPQTVTTLNYTLQTVNAPPLLSTRPLFCHSYLQNLLSPTPQSNYPHEQVFVRALSYQSDSQRPLPVTNVH